MTYTIPVPRKVKQVHSARYAPIDSLITYNALPNGALPHLDPFLFLNHHGPQQYPPDNQGLPFGPHPHRGMETVTCILDGDIMHKDSEGYQSVIGPGGVQWMRAGSGLMHEEVSSEEFKKNGGPLEILQLWVNLPARFKMAQPAYLGLQQEEIPTVESNGVRIQVLSGQWNEVVGPYKGLTEIHMAILHMTQGTTWKHQVSESETVFFYVVRGSCSLNGVSVNARQLAEFRDHGTSLEVQAFEHTIILLAYAAPFHEPIAMQGPFVMNTQEQLQEAFRDYYEGRMGVWT